MLGNCQPLEAYDGLERSRFLHVTPHVGLGDIDYQYVLVLVGVDFLAPF